MHDPALESNKRVKTNARVYFERVQRALFAVAADPNAFDALNVR
jgi:CRISPR/Cas system-associated endoribonuclease Cas2